jgi:hypothetical protein
VAVLRDRNRGDSLTSIAKAHRVSRATVSRLLKQAKDAEPVSIIYVECSKGVPPGTPQLLESRPSKSAVPAPHKVWVKTQVRARFIVAELH